MLQDEEGPLTKDEFLSECLIRNPRHRRDLIALWQELPPVFRELPVRSGVAALIARGAPQPDIVKIRLPPFWEACGTSYSVARIKEAGELHSAMLAIRMSFPAGGIGWQLVDLFRDQAQYTECTGVTPQQRDEILEAFRGKWPLWSVGRLHRPHIPLWWSSRPTILVNREVAQRGAFLDELPQGVEPTRSEEAFQAAPLLIPIYQDTRAQDFDWKEIAKWQERVYGKKQRTRAADDFRMLLDIWDRVHVKEERIPDIARDLRAAVSTTKSRYAAVNRIISSGLDKEEAKVALAAILPVARTIKQCQACMTLINAGRLNLCSVHERLVNGETKSQRESTGDLERIELAIEKKRIGWKLSAHKPD